MVGWGNWLRQVPWATLLWAAIFAVAHTQTPLFYSNQNQYFVHGMAEGGIGRLDEDWLANTRDPTPLFSALVALTHRHLGDSAFYVYYFLLLGVYFISLVKVCDLLPIRPDRGSGRFLFMAALVTVHAAILRVASTRLFGVDYPWYFQTGVAGQYVLGPGLQPSAFGVFLISALAAFGHGRPSLAASFCCLAVFFHSTYLLPAAFLTLGFMVSLVAEGRVRAALWLGGSTFMAVLPVIAYNLSQFAPTTATTFAEAQRLLAEYRIPHHALVSRWLDPIAWGQVAWMLLGIALLRGTRLFAAAAVAAALGAALSVVQAATQNETLALLFPWRISSVLLPVATAVILYRVAAIAERIAPVDWVLYAVGALTVMGSALGGLWVQMDRVGYRVNPDEIPVMNFVRDHGRAGQVYLLPVAVPKPGWGSRGAVSTSFTPPPRAGQVNKLIAVDMQGFRLYTGMPIYVDFKSIPYKDTEVVEWHRRLRQLQEWYARAEWGPETRAELKRERVTHVILTADRRKPGDFLQPVYADEAYRVYAVR